MNIYEKLRRSQHKNNNEMEKEMTITELVEKLNQYLKKRLDRNVINRIENGTQQPTCEQLVAYSKVFDVSIDYILGNEKPKSDTEIIKSISDYLSLSDITISELAKLSHVEKHIIDAMFTRSAIATSLMRTTKEMLFYSHPSAKNRSYIKLDEDLTLRDKVYEKLEQEINERQVIDIFSQRLAIEMHDILTILSKDKQLITDIVEDYRKKFFTFHKRTLLASELPKFKCDDNGNVIEDIDAEIYNTEEKIQKRLKSRDDKGKLFDYGIDIHNYSDFKERVHKYRHEKTKEEYLSWLRHIDSETE